MTRTINLSEFRIKELRNVAEVSCLFDRRKLSVPAALIDGRGDAKEEFRDSVLVPTALFPSLSAAYISPMGSFYCCERHWIKYCEE